MFLKRQWFAPRKRNVGREAFSQMPTNFILHGHVVDIDETIPAQPHHPSTVLTIASRGDSTPVIVPDSVLGDKLLLLWDRKPVKLGGELQKYAGSTHHVASRLRMLARGR
jgi:hypothetical protein